MNLTAFGCGFVLVVAMSLGDGARAEPPQAAMPPAAAGILTQMDKDIAATKMKTIVALDKVLKDTTKKGDLAGAMAVKEAIEQLKKETQAAPGARWANGAGGANAIVGKWTGQGETFEFCGDGSAKRDGAVGQCKFDGKNLDVTWSNGSTYRLMLTADSLVGVGVSAAGAEANIRLTRIK